MSISLNDEHHHGSSHSSALPLPTFRPFRDSSAASRRLESNASGSQGSSSIGREIYRLSPRNAAEGQDTRDDENRSPVSPRPRNSGGFLLDSAAKQSRLSRAFLPRSHKEPKDVKGKRKSEGSDLFVQKRRLNGTQYQNTTPIGVSPLATEIKRVLDTDALSNKGHIDAERGSTAPKSSRSVRSTGIKAANGSLSNDSENSPKKIGFDSDSAQIVNMALSLSEGRKRQGSGIRYVSRPVPDRHGVSTAQSANSHGMYQPGVATRYPDSNRRTSRNISLRPNTTHSRDAPSSLISEQVYHSGGTRQEIEDVDDQLEEDSYVISPATIIRAQKAKDQLELIYQFRRLLSHLPPLRRPGSYVNYYEADSGSRVYNPLQYVRNRKLRFRERKPLTSEDEGWHDIEQVRAWVDAVATSQQSTRYEPDECIRLPELSQRQKLDVDVDEKDPMMLESPASSVRRMSTNPLTKPRRPRSDWIVFPGDLLADAFWLEQGLNKTKIEDRDGNAIFPSDTQFKFSGWGNRAPVRLPDTHLILTQQRTPHPENQGDEEPASPRTAIPDLPTFSSVARPRQHSSRGRSKNTFRDALSSIPKSNSGSHSHDRRRRRQRETSVSSASSDEESSVRGRQRKQFTRRAREKQSVIDQHLKEMLESDDDERQTPSGQASGEASQSGSKRPSIIDNAILSKLISRTSSKHPSSGKDSPQQATSARQSTDLPRNSHEGERPRRTSTDYDITAPNSPVTNGFPSIAINLSPPQSRSPSPSKKPFSSLINPFRDRSKSQQRHGVGITDFVPSATLLAAGKVDTDVDPLSAPPSRSTSPMSRQPSLPLNDSRHQASREVHRSSTASKQSTKSSHFHHDGSGRIRGMFKGGRIAELVGTEVSRVGDFIWKRDAPNHTPRLSASTASITSIHASDSEDDLANANGHTPKTLPWSSQKRYSPAETPGNEAKTSPSTSRPTPGSGEKPQYHVSNLPSFTSPFQRDREQQDEHERGLLSPETSPPSGVKGDHISRLAADHRYRSHSPRLGRLAPPNLITTVPSPESSTARTALDRQESYGFGGGLDVTRSTSASQVYNDAINGQARPTGLPVTGLAGLKPFNSEVGVVKSWNLSDRSLPQLDSPTAVTRRDIARTAALLKSSAVKAREISRRADAIQIPPGKFVLDTVEPSNLRLHSPGALRIARRDEYKFAAEKLISSLTSQTATVRDRLRVFRQETCAVLHTDLQHLDDLVDNALAPRVRVAADQAGELSMKLTTTSTLAVKALNDTIDGALRRRRRGPIRYLRRFGYTLVEWAVVGVLWAIWLVVMLIRVAWGGVRGVYRAGKWLLFL